MADFSQKQIKPNTKKPSRYRISNLIFEKSQIKFPLKEDYERRTRTMNIKPSDANLIRGHEFERGSDDSLKVNTSASPPVIAEHVHIDEPNEEE